jgi:galactokinase/mevalonate kinase-like predicted kinase
MNQVKVSAPGRIDLSGGVIDWCGMYTLSVAINLRAHASITRLDNPEIVQLSIDGVEDEYSKPEYDGKLDLFKAVIELSGLKGFRVDYQTDIPRGSGLGGSAPLTVSTLFGLNKLFKKNWSIYYLTELAQRAETFKLQTVNGYQDQYSAAFGYLNFFDFRDKECQKGNYSKPIDQEPYGVVESLKQYMPDFHILIAVPEIIRSSSGETNGSVSERYLNGDKEILDLMARVGKLTQEAKKCVIENKIDELYKIINENNDILRKFGFLSEKNEAIVETANENNALAVKVCGAGRGGTAVFAKNEAHLEKLYQALKPVSNYIYKVKPDGGVQFE